MENLFFGFIGVGLALLLVTAFRSWRSRKLRLESEASAKLASDAWDKATAVRSIPASVGPYVHTRRERNVYPPSSSRYVAPTPAPQQSSGMDPLMAGVIGYALGSSLHSGNANASPIERDEPFSGNGGLSGGAGASSDFSSCSPSSDSGSSSSSDSGSSSYDSGSSDSGGGVSSD